MGPEFTPMEKQPDWEENPEIAEQMARASQQKKEAALDAKRIGLAPEIVKELNGAANLAARDEGTRYRAAIQRAEDGIKRAYYDGHATIECTPDEAREVTAALEERVYNYKWKDESHTKTIKTSKSRGLTYAVSKPSSKNGRATVEISISYFR